MSDTLEQTVQQIAQQGREALIERLRPTFADAAAAHADALALSDEQLAAMVEVAAGRIDGLQWRQALAIAATEELGITLGEALGHPAVVRAQVVVGAPSYEESLARYTSAPAHPDAAEAPAHPDAAEPPAESDAAEPPAESTLRIAAIHLGGIDALTPGQDGLELVFSAAGLEISGTGEERTGTLGWSELGTIEVAAPHGVRRRRRHEAHLVIRIGEAEASFQVPAVSPTELREQLAPMLERHQER